MTARWPQMVLEFKINNKRAPRIGKAVSIPFILARQIKAFEPLVFLTVF